MLSLISTLSGKICWTWAVVGGFVIFAAKKGYAVQGIDVSPIIVANAQVSLRFCGLSETLIRCSDVYKFHFRFVCHRKNSYDACQ